MTRITIALPDDVARWLRDRATRNRQSVSNAVIDLLEDLRRQDYEYESAMRRFLAVKPRKMEWVGRRKPTRDELYDRPCLRRHWSHPLG